MVGPGRMEPKYSRNQPIPLVLDRVDREIVALLRKDARRTNREIARRVGIAESTCSVRVRRLESSGAIRGYRTVVDPRVLDIGLEAIVTVQLVRHTAEAIAAFWHHAEQLGEAAHIYHLTGLNDFIIHLLVRNTEHLRDLTTGTITTWPEVARLQTSIVFEHREVIGDPPPTPPSW